KALVAQSDVVNGHLELQRVPRIRLIARAPYVASDGGDGLRQVGVGGNSCVDLVVVRCEKVGHSLDEQTALASKQRVHGPRCQARPLDNVLETHGRAITS